MMDREYEDRDSGRILGPDTRNSPIDHIPIPNVIFNVYNIVVRCFRTDGQLTGVPYEVLAVNKEVAERLAQRQSIKNGHSHTRIAETHLISQNLSRSA